MKKERGTKNQITMQVVMVVAVLTKQEKGGERNEKGTGHLVFLSLLESVMMRKGLSKEMKSDRRFPLP